MFGDKKLKYTSQNAFFALNLRQIGCNNSPYACNVAVGSGRKLIALKNNFIFFLNCRHRWLNTFTLFESISLARKKLHAMHINKDAENDGITRHFKICFFLTFKCRGNIFSSTMTPRITSNDDNFLRNTTSR